jgi:hypothetical protein
MKLPVSRRRREVTAKSDEEAAGLADFENSPAAVRQLLANAPRLLAFLRRLERERERGDILPSELHRLAKQWSAGLPLRCGATVRLLQHFMQLDLIVREGDSPPRRKARRRIRRRT